MKKQKLGKFFNEHENKKREIQEQRKAKQKLKDTIFKEYESVEEPVFYQPKPKKYQNLKNKVNH